MTQDEADKFQQWEGMDGATAWHLIDRHADSWNEIGELMNAWLRANVLVDREECAKICDEHVMMATNTDGSEWSASCAESIRMRSND
jgi:hypothetical protein